MAKSKEKTEISTEDQIKEKRAEMDELASQGWENLKKPEQKRHEKLAAEVAKLEAEVDDGSTDA
jgi:uncharacterized protein YlxW (UPF0749 family)